MSLFSTSSFKFVGLLSDFFSILFDFQTEENIGLENSGDEKEETSGLSESEESEVEDELEQSGIAPNTQDEVPNQPNEILCVFIFNFC